MEEFSLDIENHTLQCFAYNTIIVGSGAAGLCAAERLFSSGQEDVAIVTENLLGGTSRNAGSDKQTYYKLSLGGDSPDSVTELAQTLFKGGCVDGDLALVEAALSVRAFFHLVELGVPFPRDRYGQYIGYKTDYDPKQRATSAGPYTSKLMTERLEAAIVRKGIKVFDRLQAIKVLTEEKKKVIGLLCLDLDHIDDPDTRYVVFSCTNLIWATGGPACIYSDSVYPISQTGSTGIALEAGVMGKNLTEWQYGLASIRPRWNVSGSYMQALPRFFSTDAFGGNEIEFLDQYFANRNDMLSAIFLKGYQWPFDASKVWGGSSLIDIYVYIERCLKGRQVFLDFRKNASDLSIEITNLIPEAAEYLKKAGGTGKTPLERLTIINKPAIEFYREHGVDLAKEPLEIFMAAQHCNGGLSIDSNWQTNIEGFFAIGEAAGSHGIHRPGGSALNAGQVGALRATEYIAQKRKSSPQKQAPFRNSAEAQISHTITEGEALFLRQKRNENQKNIMQEDNGDKENSHIETLRKEASERMTKVGAAFRNLDDIATALTLTHNALTTLNKIATPRSPSELSAFYHYKDMLLTQLACLASMKDYLEKNGNSRGGALYHSPAGNLPHPTLPDMFKSKKDGDILQDKVQEVTIENLKPHLTWSITWRKVRPIPTVDDIFENIWKEFREENKINKSL